MSGQFDLFAKPYNGEPPAQRHSETSQAAAVSIKKAVGPLHRKILEFLRFGCPTIGSTDEEMVERLDMNPNTQRPRQRELELMGRVIDSGQRRFTRSGRLAVVWVLATT